MANSYLERTPSGAGNSKTFTISCWVKRSKLSYNYDMFYTAGLHQSTLMSQLYFIDSDELLFGAWNSNGSTNHYIKTNRKFRDTSAWYHIVVAVDTTQATAANRVKIYVNGTQETSLDTSNNYPAQNFDYAFNQTLVHNIGRRGDLASSYHDGYLSHVVMVDGQALAPTVFGETDSTSGIWKFKNPSGVTWGTNGFHLKMENSGALGTDSSGNTNTFTVNGNLKQALDTPSNVSATLNSLVNINSNLVLSNGNSTMTLGSTNWIGTLSSLGVDTGKWYWEIKVDTNNFMHGILGETANMTELSTSNSGYIGKFSNGYAFYYQSPTVRKQNNSSGSAYGTAPSSGDILMVAFDATNGTIWVGKNGTWFNSATQSEIENGTTTNSMYSSIPMTETFFPAACGESNHVANYNFGNGYFGTTAITSAGSNGNGSLFEYDVPSGYYALNTKNINTYG